MKKCWMTLRLMSPIEIVAILALVCGGALTSALTPVALKKAVDLLGDTNPGWFSSTFFIVLFIAGQGMTRAFSEAQQAYYSKAEQSAVNRQRLMLMTTFLRLPLEKLSEKSSMELQQHLNNAAKSTSIYLQTLLLSMAPTMIQMATIATVIGSFYDWKFLAVFFIGATAYIWTFGKGIQVSNDKQRGAIKATTKTMVVASDSFAHPEATKSLGLENFHYDRTKRASDASIRLWVDYFRFRLFNGLAIAGIFACTFGAAIFIAYTRLKSGQMSIGDFMLISAYALLVVHPLETVGFAYRSLKQAQILMEPIFELSANPAGIFKNAAADSKNGTLKDIEEIRFVNVFFEYKSGGVILNDVTMRIHKGKRTAFVGQTGSGKSTALRVILGLYQPTAGNLFFDQTNSKDLPREDRLERIRSVTQEPAIFNCSIRENIVLGRGSAALNKALQDSQMLDIFKEEVRDLDDEIGERGIKLSGGQRQKIGFARIFAMPGDPDFVVLDESTSSMDYQTERVILRNLYKRFPGAGIIAVAHRLASVVDFDEIVVFDKGEIVGVGTHLGLLKSCSAYQILWHGQQIPKNDEARI